MTPFASLTPLRLHFQNYKLNLRAIFCASFVFGKNRRKAGRQADVPCASCGGNPCGEQSKAKRMMVPGMWHGKEVPAKGNVVGYNHELHNCTDSATPQANIFSFTPMFISFGSINTIVRKIPFTSRHAPRLATVRS